MSLVKYVDRKNTNCAKCYKVQKIRVKSAKKYVDISQKSVIIRV